MSLLDASYVVLEPTRKSRSADDDSFAHNWSNAGLRVRGSDFVDKYNRVCNLRGVNLSGNCKTPVNHDDSTFPAHPEAVTFVGRPFPLEDAPEHFARLRRWGLTFIRFLVTWEALAPASPTVFSSDYLAYLRALLSLLPQYGLTAFVSLHQDVWSRYSGGSGAPAWTLDAVGFDIDALEQTSAAWLRGMKGGGHVEEERGLWPVGYQRLAAATMATCFWAGDTFLPKLRLSDAVDGKAGSSIQAFLQDAFLNAWEALARAVGDLDGVLGLEMMNEPHRGYIELPSLHGFDYNTDLHLREVPSSLAGFAMGAGHPARVPFYSRSFPMPTRFTHYIDLDPKGRSVWRADGPSKGECPWEMHGVWGWDRVKSQAVVLRENYFMKHPQTGNKVDWYTDFYYPFLKRWVQRVRGVPGVQNKLIFVEAIPNEFCPRSWTAEHQFDGMVYAPHWYDLRALFEKAFGNLSVNVQGLSRGMSWLRVFYWGHESARENYALQLGSIASEARKSLGSRPVIIGECGIPMDMNHKKAFSTGDFTWQAKMMDAMISGLERNLLGFTLWNYNPDNNDTQGDAWCGENFSWFGTAHRRTSTAFPKLADVTKSPPSELKQVNAALDDGARILRAVVRPYPAKVAGIPRTWEYDLNTGVAEFEWETDNNVLTTVTEVFFPEYLLDGGRKIVIEGKQEDGEDWKYDRERQTLFLVGRRVEEGEKELRAVKIRVEPPLNVLFETPTHLQSFHIWYSMAVGILVLFISWASGLA